MKDTLEYKILKHLKENDNGDFIDIRDFIDDRKLLESKLRSLSKEPGKYISAIFTFFIIGGGQPDFIDDQLKAKIEFKGLKFLDEIEKENKNITNNGIYIDKNENKGNQSFEKIEVKKNKIKQRTHPTKKPSIWAIIKSFCVKFWWTFIIPLVAIVIGILIERGVIGIGI